MDLCDLRGVRKSADVGAGVDVNINPLRTGMERSGLVSVVKRPPWEIGIVQHQGGRQHFSGAMERYRTWWQGKLTEGAWLSVIEQPLKVTQPPLM